MFLCGLYNDAVSGSDAVNGPDAVSGPDKIYQLPLRLSRP